MNAVRSTNPSLVSDLIALTKPRLTAMVLITTGASIWLASLWNAAYAVSAWVALSCIVGTTMVVAAANTLNCWLEADIDKHMARTKNRPLPSGRMQVVTALYFGLALSVVSVALLYFGVNPITGWLGAFGLLSYVWVYTPLKQKTPHALLIGAVPGAIPPLMGWTAATGRLDMPGLVLFGILFFWQLPHFIAISIFRKNEYERAGIKVVPSVMGESKARTLMVLYAGALVPVSLLLIPLGISGKLYAAAALISGAAFFISCVRGFSVAVLTDKLAAHRWARSVFFVSLFYLPIVLTALLVDAAMR